MVSCFISRIVILVFGTLYPAYASYKAVRTKNVKEYVKWMMYWIVFALFTSIETFTDLFLSFWFPFYYELKIITVIYLLSPATNGSSILYRKFVHPVLTKREQEIDEYIAKAKEQGYHTVLNLGSKGVTYATSLIMQTAIKGLPILQVTPSREFIPDKNIESKDSLNLEEECAHLKELKDIDFVEEEKKPSGASDAFDGKMVKEQEAPVTDVLWVKQPIRYEDLSSLDEISLQNQHESIQGGGGLVSHLKKSYSLSDLSDDPSVNSRKDEVDYHRYDDPRVTRRLPLGANNQGLFFPEVDSFQRPLAPMNDEEYYSRLPSSEEISSGYSSGDPLYYGFTQSPGDPLVRTASLGGAGGTRVRTRASTRTALPKRGSLAEGSPYATLPKVKKAGRKKKVDN